MRNRPLTVALCLLAVAAGSIAMGRDALHGKWTATLMPEAGGKDRTDTLTFTRGDLFSTEEMTKQGYEPTPYNDRGSPIGVAATWNVTLKNKAGDTAVWQGTVAANEMTGSVVVTPKDGAPVNYTFKAEKK